MYVCSLDGLLHCLTQDEERAYCLRKRAKRIDRYVGGALLIKLQTFSYLTHDDCACSRLSDPQKLLAQYTHIYLSTSPKTGIPTRNPPSPPQTNFKSDGWVATQAVNNTQALGLLVMEVLEMEGSQLRRSSIKRPWEEAQTLPENGNAWHSALLHPIDAVPYRRGSIQRGGDDAAKTNGTDSEESAMKKTKFEGHDYNTFPRQNQNAVVLNGKAAPSRNLSK